MNPVASEAIMQTYNHFRSQVMILQELKSAMQNIEYEMEGHRTKMQEIGKEFEIEPRFRVSNVVEGGLDDSQVGGEGMPSTNRRIMSYIDANLKDLTAVRKKPHFMF